ncbi:penicillin-binding protein [Flavobacterium sp.]|uniref:penicillin-binding protein n=1 Tax=Flavobacterium sp. TaxID=239 RepID=UPI00262BE6DC|nr:penicillin-binding protein [Flavobacterium sp.]
MVRENNSINYRIYLVFLLILLFAIAIVCKLTSIQWKYGAYYRKLAERNTIKTFIVPANKGSIYSSDGSLLAISIPEYTIAFNATIPSDKNFNGKVDSLSHSLSKLFGKPQSYYYSILTKAKQSKRRYVVIQNKVNYSNYVLVKKLPLFNLGSYKSGLIADLHTIRAYPLGAIARRTVGYTSIDNKGNSITFGIEGSYDQYLNGKDGKILKQKIAHGEYKPIRDENEVEPIDGYDVISTIDVYIQDIAHHALLDALKKFDAEHGCVVVMETKTGFVKAIANLGKGTDSKYYEQLNYAVREKGEPGSTFKLVDMIALLEDKKVDTSKVYDRNGGLITFFGKDVVDSHRDGPQRISLAKGFEISSNTVLVKAVYENYKNNPKQFVDRINNMGLNKPLGLCIKGEGIPFVPQPNTPKWNGISLPWIAFGYGVEVTPMQTLTLYNAIANNGEMIKPQFVSEIRDKNKTIKKFEKEIINPKICFEGTVKKLKALLENVVKKGTAKSIYSKNFSMAGKTGTAQGNYGINNGVNKHYISSFVGFFPVDKPKFSCIVVIHKPSTKNNNYYGADVAGPVFKRIAQKIITDLPISDNVEELNKKIKKQEQNYSSYSKNLTLNNQLIPNLKGMPGMDAIALLENKGLKVKLKGNLLGKVKSQSIKPNVAVRKSNTIELILQ